MSVNATPDDGRLRDAGYTCGECQLGWQHVTDKPLPIPGTCPFCGGRSRITRGPEDVE